MNSISLDLLEQIPENVILKDKDSIYIIGNTAAANLLGFNKLSKFAGITDFKLRCRAAEFAEGFREQDRYVIFSIKL